jgi:adenylyl cyclase-associated protein
MAGDQGHVLANILGHIGLILAPDNVLTAMVGRLEAATSRLEDIASVTYPNGEPAADNASRGAQSPGPAAKLATAASAAPTPQPPTPSLPPAIEAYDEIVEGELKAWLELSGMLGEVIEGQSKAVQQAFVAQRHLIFIAIKAKKPDDRVLMELIRGLQASIEKADEIKQRVRDAALRDPLTMVADAVATLCWITFPPSTGKPNEVKPHEVVKDLFGGAQAAGNKVLMAYKDKYDHMTQFVCSMKANRCEGQRTGRSSIGCEPTTSCLRLTSNT